MHYDALLNNFNTGSNGDLELFSEEYLQNLSSEDNNTFQTNICEGSINSAPDLCFYEVAVSNCKINSVESDFSLTIIYQLPADFMNDPPDPEFFMSGLNIQELQSSPRSAT